MPAFQQGQWPNLAPRNTLFGGEELADIMLHGRLSDDIVTSAGRENAQLAAVLASEQKSLLVALTRADERVTVSAVLNEDHVPSDFLYGYLPEWFDRDRDADAETRVYTAVARPANTRTGADHVAWSPPREACWPMRRPIPPKRAMPRKPWRCWHRMASPPRIPTIGRSLRNMREPTI
mgnify:CR=1 FL=1